MEERSQVRRVSVDEVEVEVAETGDPRGEAVLLVHGGVFADWFVPVAEDPALQGVRVIRIRRAGYVTGAAPPRPLTIGDHGQLCSGVLEALGVHRAHVVGHSSGALASVELALDRPALVASLLLVEPARAGDTWPASAEARAQVAPLLAAARAGDVGGAFRGFMEVVCGADAEDVVASTLGADGHRRAERESAYFFADEMPAVLDWPFDAARAAGIRQSVLVVQGELSPPHVHEAMAQLAAWLPDARVETVEGSDHMLPLRHPAQLAALIAAHVRRSS